ncbi:MAG: rhodanese-like domain-containing protein [Hyphomicrobiales bacterium]|nr:rhodanese-like domain-containing protein [Hyphomicrobiales bacterium]
MSGSEHQTEVEDVEVKEVWRRLAEESGAVLVDVRTQAEWTFVGLPDLSAIGKQVVTVEWQTFPGAEANASFVDQLASGLSELGAGPDTSLFFICRSGGRSLAAAKAMAAAGYRGSHNVAGGFEGPLDSDRHRGSVAGWVAAGLPWVQG